MNYVKTVSAIILTVLLSSCASQKAFIIEKSCEDYGMTLEDGAIKHCKVWKPAK